MYCRNCGQQIEDDSKFCKHCGAQVDDIVRNKSTKSIRYLYEQFLSLPSKWQGGIMGYMLWVLGWICAVLITGMEGSVSDYEVALFLAFLSIIVLPIVVFTFIHFRKIRRAKQDKSTKVKEDTAHAESKENKTDTDTSQHVVDVDNKEIERFSLHEFSLLYGKMQVRVVRLTDGSTESYCVFTNDGIETRVDFERSLGVLNATEISSQKSDLYIIEYPDKQYILSKQ